MPHPSEWPELTPEERVAATEAPRRNSRFKAAKERCERLAAGEPEFTDAQLSQLALIFLRAGGHRAAS
jgi:hypothetical protein